MPPEDVALNALSLVDVIGDGDRISFATTPVFKGFPTKRNYMSRNHGSLIVVLCFVERYAIHQSGVTSDIGYMDIQKIYEGNDLDLAVLSPRFAKQVESLLETKPSPKSHR